MEPAQDLEKISGIVGVKSYYLVTHDGSQVAGKSNAATELSQYFALSGLNGEAICSLLGNCRFNHMIFSRQGKESIIIFPMKDHFLAVMKEAHASTANLIPRISELIDGIKI